MKSVVYGVPRILGLRCARLEGTVRQFPALRAGRGRLDWLSADENENENDYANESQINIEIMHAIAKRPSADS